MKNIDDLFLEFLRNRNLDVVLARLQANSTLSASFDLDRLAPDLSRLEAAEPSEFSEVFSELTPALPIQLRTLYLFRYVIARVVAHPRGPEDYSRIERVPVEVEESCHILIEICRIVGLWISGVECRPVAKLQAVRPRLARLEPSVSRAFIEALAEHSLGYAYKEFGDFRGSERCFARAAELSSFYEFYTMPIHRSAFAKLTWESGQYRKALELHCDGEARRLARELGEEQHLIDSHLCAAKAALDLGSLEKAQEELESADRRLRASEHAYPILAGYSRLFRAQLEAKNGHADRARVEFERAVSEFQSLDPPCYAGALDAKIELVRLDLNSLEFGRALRQVEELLAEAEDRQILGARTRLLALQAHLFVSSKSPDSLLRNGYDNLVERLQLMNNPRLMFLACADLYSYAREHLDRTEQRNWLERLRELEPLLERSCYEDLYRDYVTEQYRSEFERGLEQYLREQSENSGE